MEQGLKIFLWIIGTLIIAGLVVFMVLHLFFRKWYCQNGLCHQKIGGDYTSESECQRQCTPLSSASQTVQSPKNVGYDCVKEGDYFMCKANENGTYNKYEDCKNQCSNQQATDYIFPHLLQWDYQYPGRFPRPYYPRRRPRRH